MKNTIQNTPARRSSRNQVQILWSGLEAYSRRLETQRALYAELISFSERFADGESVVRLRDSLLFRTALKVFGPALPQALESENLHKLYEVAIDRPSGAVIIANRGATLWCLSPKTESPYLTRHIGLSIYLPGLGVETVNVGLTGNVYQGPLACRSESACTPSFLFGSQRCNCCHQWDSFRELAAVYNPAPGPKLPGPDFERWVQKQCEYRDGRHIFQRPGPGFVFVHLDSQNGMGSGATDGEFTIDLFNRASLRHRGEYSAEQMLDVTMAGGFTAIGLTPDPRGEQGGLGYAIAPIILDYLGVSKDIALLSNNHKKLDAMKARGYRLRRVKSLGAVNRAGALEAEQRGTEFGHLDIDGQLVSFDEELERLRSELGGIFEKRSCRTTAAAEDKPLSAAFAGGL